MSGFCFSFQKMARMKNTGWRKNYHPVRALRNLRESDKIERNKFAITKSAFAR